MSAPKANGSSDPGAASGAERLFGTDGIRGQAGVGWLTPGAVSALGRAIGAELDGAAVVGRPRRALVGHDGRSSGPRLEAAVTRGLAASGYAVTTAELVTTPALALLTHRRGFDLGVMISASHNPARDNGIKIFGPSGEKLDDAVEDRIEARLRADPLPEPEGPFARPDTTLRETYLAHLVGSVGGLRLDGMRIVVDGANGGGSVLGPRALARLGAEVIPIACDPDGQNINKGCGSTHPEGLCAAVKDTGSRLGIALDGDGDRCVFADERGRVVHGDAVLSVLARFAHEEGRLAHDRLVATVMSNHGLHRSLRPHGIEVLTVGVGDRRVVEALRREGLSLGGEQSGHVVFGSDNDYIGDGIYTGLRMLRVLRATESTLGRLTEGFEPLPQVLVNVPVSRKPELAEMPAVASEVARCEERLGEDGRVLLRYSGTEPLARVMVEGPDEAEVRAMAERLARLLAREIGGP